MPSAYFNDTTLLHITEGYHLYSHMYAVDNMHVPPPTLQTFVTALTILLYSKRIKICSSIISEGNAFLPGQSNSTAVRLIPVDLHTFNFTTGISTSEICSLQQVAYYY
jgi:hypothetical protein